MSSFMPQMLIRRAVQWVLAPLFAPLWRRLGRLFMRSAETAGLSGAPTGGTSGFEASLPPTITLLTAETNSPRFGPADVTLHDGKDSGHAPAGRWQAKWQSVG